MSMVGVDESRFNQRKQQQVIRTRLLWRHDSGAHHISRRLFPRQNPRLDVLTELACLGYNSCATQEGPRMPKAARLRFLLAIVAVVGLGASLLAFAQSDSAPNS